ncbi:MAG: hypothetical protein IPQ09_19545 [Myxococcales bacterium]|nr:hypothetical protein [Myxococcales bacterium]
MSALAERDAAIASLQALIASLQGRSPRFESALTNHASENELLKRRLYGTKSERSGTSELQLTLGNLLADQAKLKRSSTRSRSNLRGPRERTARRSRHRAGFAPPPPEEAESEKPRPKGRAISASKLPRVVVEIRDGGAEASGGRLIDWETRLIS